jgi:3-methyladenine DNA glycosylase Tag
MQKEFIKDYPKFQAKIKAFIENTKFKERLEEYHSHFEQMLSISPDDMREYAERSPKFLDARNRSLALMERILEIHRNLEEIFAMDMTTLGETFKYDLKAIDQKIADDVKESAALLHQFEIESEKGRKAIEEADSPFFSQAL